MHTLVTGGAGFIGSHLCDSLAQHNWEVTILDNLSAGSKENVRHLLKRTPKKVKLLEGDCTNPAHVRKALENIEIVYHFAANPEVRLELSDPQTCFRQNIYATHILLQQLKDNMKIHTVIFASTSTVYGEPKTIPTPESYGPLKPISLYGASKLASEALISAYARTYDKKAVILRLANTIGPRSQHGVVHDFILKLRRNPRQLEILGDGTQTKSYLYIDDCIKAIETAYKTARNRVEICNVGSEDQTSVTQIAEIITEEMGLNNVKLIYTGGVDGGRGWKGDVKKMLLDITKIKSKGWKPKHNSLQALRRTVKHLVA
ncbi:MAG: SDR family NAD(P)-dependent oxidoreductase [Candidatus Bathyarchaeota archaeon]|nr:SDR family NAD(P)-dependent oxidoreductase [Candidatus Bathyarchaeota archaeon]